VSAERKDCSTASGDVGLAKEFSPRDRTITPHKSPRDEQSPPRRFSNQRGVTHYLTAFRHSGWTRRLPKWLVALYCSAIRSKPPSPVRSAGGG